MTGAAGLPSRGSDNNILHRDIKPVLCRLSCRLAVLRQLSYGGTSMPTRHGVFTLRTSVEDAHDQILMFDADNLSTLKMADFGMACILPPNATLSFDHMDIGQFMWSAMMDKKDML
jgi:serine/threonine protein kinase